MSSYIMHMCISDVVKRKLNLTDKFVYGSILPDILKMVTGDRTTTHFLNEMQIGDEWRRLPVIDKAIKELTIEDKEIRLGYIAHLVEDLIWFNDFIPQYATKVSDNKYKYLTTGEIKEATHFTKDMYQDYSNCGAYIIESTNTDFETVKKNVFRYIDKDICMTQIIQNTNYTESSDIDKNIFMTKESIDKYIKIATKAVENVMLELIGE